MRTFSFGGGVQSTAVLALQAMGRLPDPYDAYLFANVGADSEHPDTLRYYEEVHVPFAEKHGIRLEELHKVKRDGTRETLYGRLTKPGGEFLGIPVFLAGGSPGNRKCTADFKIHVVRKWQRKNGSSRDNPFVTGLGISVDEIQRARSASRFDDQIFEYPLLDLGYSRRKCYEVIEEAGLPPAPRSACFFCPFHRKEHWRSLRREHPDLFTTAVQLEEHMNVTRQSQADRGVRSALLSPRVWLTKHLRPLDQAIDDQLQFDFEGPDSCDSGHCFT